MILKGSRYSNTPSFSLDTKKDAFTGVSPRKITPLPGVIEHTVSRGDRLDLLATYYYNDSRTWFRILDANPDIVFGGSLSLDKMEGHIIVIPRAE